MSGYTKLFNSILASTIWRSDDKTRLVWITMLAMTDKRGVVESSIPGLADFARVSLTDCQKALSELAAPDEFSRTKEFEGRRIEPIDGGWRLINHGKYRDKMGKDERREYLKVKQREYREKQKQRRKQSSTIVNNVSDKSTVLTHTDPDPYTAPDPEIPVINNKLDRKADAPTTSTAAALKLSPVDGQSKRPIFRGQRFTVFEWMLEDISQMLGPHYEGFGLDEFFDRLDKIAARTNVVLPKLQVWPWLQQRVLAEAASRGLAIASAAEKPHKRDVRDAEALALMRSIQ